MRVYLDNAATTCPSKAALQAANDVATAFYANPSSLYTDGQLAKEKLEEVRSELAAMIGAKPQEIVFTSGGSEADNQAILSAAARGEKQGKKHIVSTAFEHHAVLHTLEALKERGFEITLLPVHENGIVRPEEVAAAIRPETCLVSVMYANNEIGTIQPIEEIGGICREKKVWFHTDAVQAVGHVRVDVEKENIDLLSLSAHKFHGLKGVGALYARRGVTLTPLVHGGAQERGKRAGTENLVGVCAMVAALKESLENLEAKQKRITALRNRLIDGLKKIPHGVLNGDREKRLPGNVNFCFEGIEGEGLLLWLDDKGLSASSGSACTSGSLDPSHVLLAIGRVHDVAHGSLRLTLDESTREEEIDYAIKSVAETVEYLRGFSPVWKDLQEGKREYVIQ